MMYDALNYGDQVNEAKKRHQKNKDYRSSEEFCQDSRKMTN